VQYFILIQKRQITTLSTLVFDVKEELGWRKLDVFFIQSKVPINKKKSFITWVGYNCKIGEKNQ
jgi:hypothetical protein